MTYIGAVFPVQLTRDTSQISKWGQTRLGCVPLLSSSPRTTLYYTDTLYRVLSYENVLQWNTSRYIRDYAFSTSALSLLPLS